VSAVRPTAVERAWLCDDSMPLPAVVWSALWAALGLAALVAPGPAVPEPPAMTDASVVSRPPLRAPGREPQAVFATGASGHSPPYAQSFTSAQPGIQP
jgi:hypothetical protein